MPSEEEIIRQQIQLWKQSIHEERLREQRTSRPSALLPRLLDGLNRSRHELSKLEER
jgi:hypothetical protein